MVAAAALFLASGKIHDPILLVLSAVVSKGAETAATESLGPLLSSVL
jgi:hypothetical protein